MEVTPANVHEDNTASVTDAAADTVHVPVSVTDAVADIVYVPVSVLDAEAETIVESTSSSIVFSSETLGRGHGENTSSVKLKDYVTYNTQCKDTSPHALTASTPESLSSVQGTSFYPLTE